MGCALVVAGGDGVCGDAGTTPGLQAPTPQPAATLFLPSAERTILSQYILGNEMPYPINLLPNEQSVDPATLPLTFDELERVRVWIAQGAPTFECSQCPSAH